MLAKMDPVGSALDLDDLAAQVRAPDRPNTRDQPACRDSPAAGLAQYVVGYIDDEGTR
jgi:hypothetical protein